MYDLIIIGGGPAGYLGAERAAHSGLSTLLFEKRAVGGVCLNEGCIPSKTLLHSAKIYDYANGYGEKYGVSVKEASLDFPAVIKRKNKVVRALVGGIEDSLKKLKVTIVREDAKIEGRVDGGYEVSAAGKKYQAKKLIIAAGSEPVIPPISGIDGAVSSGFALTSREILDLTVVPEKLVIIGGGVIGLEMASVFNSAGSKVTVVEMLPKIAGQTDVEISKILQKNYEKKGVKFILNAKVVGFDTNSIEFELDGKREKLSADKVLLSIGRRASTAGLGLETIGVEMSRGAVMTDDQMKTNVPGVFAAGDVNGKSMLAHTAYREAEVAVNIISGKKDRMDYSAIPYVIYTNPEAAGVGETLETAKQKGFDAREVKLPMLYSGRYMAENEGGDGISKLVVENGTNRLLGVHMLGNPASEIVAAACLALTREIDIESLKKVVFPHPSVSEIIREGIFKV